MIKKLKDMGVKGHLPKTFDQNQLIEAILTIKNMQDFFPLLDKNNNFKPPNRFKLTSRELEIIYLIAVGNTTKEMAAKLKLSDYTIDTHRKNIIRKTNAKSTLEVLNLAKELNLID
jgi:DNA-binding NarL/FixJ family response regulator